MKMRVKIEKWGNSGALRLPARLLARAGLEIGCSVEIEAREGELLVKTAGRPDYRLAELLARCPPRKMALSTEDEEWLDTTPAGREVW